MDVPKNEKNDINMPNQDDYRIKIANRHLKCISNYVNCDNKDNNLFPCDQEFMKCITKSVSRHVNSIEHMKKKKPESKVKIDEFPDEN